METIQIDGLSQVLGAIMSRADRGLDTDVLAIRGIDNKIRVRACDVGDRMTFPPHLRPNVTIIAKWRGTGPADAEAWLSKLRADVGKLADLARGAPPPGAAPCPCCKQPMNGVGCGVDKVRARAYFGGAKRRIRADAKCRDCAAPEGGYHHFGCCVAVCPYCKGQERYCECDNTATKKRKITAAA